MKIRKISLLTISFLILAGLSSYIQNKSDDLPEENTSDLQAAKTMHVKGRFLFTAANEKVILRGVNEMFIWSTDHTGKQALSEISKTGANSVRLVWTTEGKPEELDMLIENCLKNKMIPIVELHDATGDFKKLDKVIEYWKKPEVVQVINKYQKWILVNIANEVGEGNTPDAVFLSSYKNAISALREAGYNMPLMIDASDWGKDETMILRTWRELRAHDKLKNVIFSVHTYWVDTNAEKRMDKFLAKVVSDTIPFLFGEGPEPFGWDCKTTFPYLYCIEQCQKLGIGWLSWSWGALKNGDCKTDGGYDMTSDGTYGNWNNDWGRLIASDDKNSIKNTSIRPPSLLRVFEK